MKGGRKGHGNVLNSIHISGNVDADLLQQLTGYGAGNHAAGRFPRGRTASSSVVPKSIFRIVGEVRMRRAVGGGEVTVIRGVLVLVSNDESDGSAGGFSFEESTEPFDLIGLFARCRKFRLTGPSSIQLSLDGFDVQLESSRTAIDDSSQCLSMRFSKRREFE